MKFVHDLAQAKNAIWERDLLVLRVVTLAALRKYQRMRISVRWRRAYQEIDPA